MKISVVAVNSFRILKELEFRENDYIYNSCFFSKYVRETDSFIEVKIPDGNDKQKVFNKFSEIVNTYYGYKTVDENVEIIKIARFSGNYLMYEEIATALFASLFKDNIEYTYLDIVDDYNSKNKEVLIKVLTDLKDINSSLSIYTEEQTDFLTLNNWSKQIEIDNFINYFVLTDDSLTVQVQKSDVIMKSAEDYLYQYVRPIAIGKKVAPLEKISILTFMNRYLGKFQAAFQDYEVDGKFIRKSVQDNIWSNLSETIFHVSRSKFDYSAYVSWLKSSYGLNEITCNKSDFPQALDLFDQMIGCFSGDGMDNMLFRKYTKVIKTRWLMEQVLVKAYLAKSGDSSIYKSNELNQKLKCYFDKFGSDDLYKLIAKNSGIENSLVHAVSTSTYSIIFYSELLLDQYIDELNKHNG